VNAPRAEGASAQAGWLAPLALAALAGALPALLAPQRCTPIALIAYAACVALPLGVPLGARAAQRAAQRAAREAEQRATRGAEARPAGSAARVALARAGELVLVCALAPCAWSLAIAWCEARHGELPSAGFAACALYGLHAAGAALGRALGAQRARRAAALALLAGCALALAPSRAGQGEPLLARRAPRVAALVLDLSPATLALECAGLDWMRHPATYHPAGTDWYSDRRAPWRAPLAGSAALVLGCLAAALSVRARTREERP
jgi:hypothetical protein